MPNHPLPENTHGPAHIPPRLQSQYAADIFKGILKEAEASSSRIQGMNIRAHGVLSTLEKRDIEKYIKEHQTSYNFGEVSKPRRAVEKTSTQMFEQSSRKAALQAQYVLANQ